MPIIDGHTHIFAPSQVANRATLARDDPPFAEMYGPAHAKMAGADALLEAMDRAAIDSSVICGFAFASQREVDLQNDYLLAAAGESHARLLPLATVNLALPSWNRVVVDASEAGARGFGELRPHSQGWDPLGPVAWRFYEVTTQMGSILLWHVSEPIGHAYPGKTGGISPWEVLRVAEAFPSLRMIAAHLGGGLPFFLQMPEVRRALGNVYFDTAAHSLLYDDQSVARLVDLAGPDRVIFGSDYPLLSPRRQLQRVQALLPADAARAVCGDTAGSLFRDIREQ